MAEMRRLLDLMDGVATDPVTESTLAEGRYNGSALLYHSSDPGNALLIISSGNIEPRTTATIGGHKVNGVSLTRSRWFAMAYNSVIFGFDEQKVDGTAPSHLPCSGVDQQQPTIRTQSY